MRTCLHIILGLLLSFNISCQTSSEKNRQTANETMRAQKTGRHYIITVHGFNGLKGTFGQMEQVLIPHLQQLHPGTDYRFLNFTYPTGTDTDVFDFAYNHLSKFLNAYIKNPTMNDSISFITHSQGGMITTVWKAAAQYGMIYNDDPQYNHVLNDKIYAQITDNIINLGTPYWGANLAKIALNTGILKSDFNEELDGLVFNSELILWLRHLAITLNGKTNDDTTQYSNMAGVMPNEHKKIFYSKELIRGGFNQAIADVINSLFKGIIRRHSFSSEKLNSRNSDKFESDLTVIVPSTRSSFYYLDKKLSCETPAVDSGEFSYINLFKKSDYLITEGMHIAAISKRTRGIAHVPLFCLDAAKCPHPTYRYMLSTLANCNQVACNSDAKTNILDKMFETNKLNNEYNEILTSGVDLQGFSMDINLQVPSDYAIPEKFYSDRPYTDTETLETDADGNEVYITRRKKKTLSERDIREKKLAREIVKLDTTLLPTELKDMVDIRIIRKREGMSGLSCWGKSICSNANELRVHITGWIKPKSLAIVERYHQQLNEKYRDGLTLPFTIQLPASAKYKFKKTTLLGRVRPGYSTFVKLDLMDAKNCSPENNTALNR